MSKDALADEILVVDLESTCWDKDPPPGEISDIIEIGVAHLDRKLLNVTDNWGIFVIPTRSKITPFSTSLNHIEDGDIKLLGVDLKDAFDMLKARKSRQRTWASWGNYDRKKMEDDSHDLRLAYPMSPRHINVKTLFAVLYGLDREVGMDKAIELLHSQSSHWKLHGKHHSGKDDAKNIALILAHMIGQFRNPLAEAGIV